jgi:hypothetical protein
MDYKKKNCYNAYLCVPSLCVFMQVMFARVAAQVFGRRQAVIITVIEHIVGMM